MIRLKKFRYLLGFLDTEGGIIEKPLTQMSLLINYTVKSDIEFKNMKYEKPIFHLLNFESVNENKSPNLKAYKLGVKILLDHYKCKGLIIIAWNAKHDAKILLNYFNNDNIYFIDAIQWAKILTKFHSYKQKEIMKKYDLGTQQHNSLSDTMDMIECIKYIYTDYETRGKLSVEDLKIEVDIRKTDEIFERIIDDNMFKVFSIKDISIASKSNYKTYEILGEKYKIREGYEKASKTLYKGYGLYKFDTLKGRYSIVRDIELKTSIIESIKDKDLLNHTNTV